MFDPPRFSIPIPTKGAPTLERALRSCLEAGLGEHDEVIVVVDTFGDGSGWLLSEIQRRVSQFADPRFRVAAFNFGRHCHGNPQRQHGNELARPGHWIVGQDDDDSFSANALRIIRERLATASYLAPHVFRFEVYVGGRRLLPHPGSEFVAEGQYDGHCLVTPNLPGKVGRWTARYAADWDLYCDTVARWAPVAPIFHEEVIGAARPHLEPRSRIVPA